MTITIMDYGHWVREVTLLYFHIDIREFHENILFFVKKEQSDFPWTHVSPEQWRTFIYRVVGVHLLIMTGVIRQFDYVMELYRFLKLSFMRNNGCGIVVEENEVDEATYSLLDDFYITVLSPNLTDLNHLISGNIRDGDIWFLNKSTTLFTKVEYFGNINEIQSVFATLPVEQGDFIDCIVERSMLLI